MSVDSCAVVSGLNMGPGPSSEKHSSQRNAAALLVALCEFHVLSSLISCMVIEGTSQVLASFCHNMESHRSLVRMQRGVRGRQDHRLLRLRHHRCGPLIREGGTGVSNMLNSLFLIMHPRKSMPVTDGTQRQKQIAQENGGARVQT